MADKKRVKELQEILGSYTDTLTNDDLIDIAKIIKARAEAELLKDLVEDEGLKKSLLDGFDGFSDAIGLTLFERAVYKKIIEETDIETLVDMATGGSNDNSLKETIEILKGKGVIDHFKVTDEGVEVGFNAKALEAADSMVQLQVKMLMAAASDKRFRL